MTPNVVSHRPVNSALAGTSSGRPTPRVGAPVGTGRTGFVSFWALACPPDRSTQGKADKNARMGPRTQRGRPDKNTFAMIVLPFEDLSISVETPNSSVPLCL